MLRRKAIVGSGFFISLLECRRRHDNIRCNICYPQRPCNYTLDEDISYL